MNTSLKITVQDLSGRINEAEVFPDHSVRDLLAQTGYKTDDFSLLTALYLGKVLILDLSLQKQEVSDGSTIIVYTKKLPDNSATRSNRISGEMAVFSTYKNNNNNNNNLSSFLPEENVDSFIYKEMAEERMELGYFAEGLRVRDLRIHLHDNLGNYQTTINESRIRSIVDSMNFMPDIIPQPQPTVLRQPFNNEENAPSVKKLPYGFHHSVAHRYRRESSSSKNGE